MAKQNPTPLPPPPLTRVMKNEYEKKEKEEKVDLKSVIPPLDYDFDSHSMFSTNNLTPFLLNDWEQKLISFANYIAGSSGWSEGYNLELIRNGTVPRFEQSQQSFLERYPLYLKPRIYNAIDTVYKRYAFEKNTLGLHHLIIGFVTHSNADKIKKRKRRMKIIEIFKELVRIEYALLHKNARKCTKKANDLCLAKIVYEIELNKLLNP
jgi:hypothetical protein